MGSAGQGSRAGAWGDGGCRRPLHLPGRCAAHPCSAAHTHPRQTAPQSPCCGSSACPSAGTGSPAEGQEAGGQVRRSAAHGAARPSRAPACIPAWGCLAALPGAPTQNNPAQPHLLLCAVEQVGLAALLRLEHQHARRLARVLAAVHKHHRLEPLFERVGDLAGGGRAGGDGARAAVGARCRSGRSAWGSLNAQRATRTGSPRDSAAQPPAGHPAEPARTFW